MKASLVESDYAADSRRAVKRQHGQEDLYNLFSDTEYYASIDVGTPARPYYVILDTGSADLWLASSECTEDQGCEATLPQYGTVASSTRRPFDASADQGGLGAVSRNSVTLNSTSTGDRTAISRPVAGSPENPGSFAVSYGSGRANGQLISDVVSMAGHTVPAQTFAICNNITDGLLTGQLSGIMGLGYQGIASSKAVPFWENIARGASQQASSDPFEMGFAFTRFLHDPSSADEVKPGGSMSFGKANESLYQGEIQWNNVVETGYWKIELQDIAVNRTSLNLASSAVAVDTGTSLIGAPADAVAAIFAEVPGSRPSDDPLYDGYYIFPCATSVTVSLTFGGNVWPVSPLDFNLGRVSAPTSATVDDSMCLGAIFSLASPEPTADGSPAPPAYIIGDTFLKNVYSVFRYETPRAVGFAELSLAADELKELAVPSNNAYTAQAASPNQAGGAASSLAGSATSSRVYVTAVLAVLASVVLI